MDKLKQLESFVSVATRGSLTAAAKAEGVAPAIMGRRLDALEERLGVKLLVRTTRRITLTHEGSAFLEDCQRLLADLANAEASVSAGGVKASGHLRITAPAGFGRRHVAPLVPRFREAALGRDDLAEPERPRGRSGRRGLRLRRAGWRLADSSLVSVRMADNRRLCVATPQYLNRHGTPQHPSELIRFDCLRFPATLRRRAAGRSAFPSRMATRSSTSSRAGRSIAPMARCCTTGAWPAMASPGAARGKWKAKIAAGRLAEVLADFAAPPNGIYAVFPQRKHLPLRVRLWIDFLKHNYSQPEFWKSA